MFPTPKMRTLPVQDCPLTNMALRMLADHGRDLHLQHSRNRIKHRSHWSKELSGSLPAHKGQVTSAVHRTEHPISWVASNFLWTGCAAIS